MLQAIRKGMGKSQPAPAINAEKIRQDLGWAPQERFETGLRKTVEWYLANQPWVATVQSGDYRKWIDSNYANR